MTGSALSWQSGRRVSVGTTRAWPSVSTDRASNPPRMRRSQVIVRSRARSTSTMCGQHRHHPRECHDRVLWRDRPRLVGSLGAHPSHAPAARPTRAPAGPTAGCRRPRTRSPTESPLTECACCGELSLPRQDARRQRAEVTLADRQPTIGDVARVAGAQVLERVRCPAGRAQERVGRCGTGDVADLGDVPDTDGMRMRISHPPQDPRDPLAMPGPTRQLPHDRHQRTCPSARPRSITSPSVPAPPSEHAGMSSAGANGPGARPAATRPAPPPD